MELKVCKVLKCPLNEDTLIAREEGGKKLVVSQVLNFVLYVFLYISWHVHPESNKRLFHHSGFFSQYLNHIGMENSNQDMVILKSTVRVRHGGTCL